MLVKFKILKSSTHVKAKQVLGQVGDLQKLGIKNRQVSVPGEEVKRPRTKTGAFKRLMSSKKLTVVVDVVNSICCGVVCVVACVVVCGVVHRVVYGNFIV